MKNKDIELLIDLLIYLDTTVCWNNQTVNVAKALTILNQMGEKRPILFNDTKRHELISKIVKQLEALKK